MLAIPYRQQLPPAVMKALDSLVPNIKKDILGSVQTSNLTDFVDWTGVTPTPSMFNLLDPTATWTVTVDTIRTFAFKIVGKSMRIKFHGTGGLTGTPNQLCITLPAGQVCNMADDTELCTYVETAGINTVGVVAISLNTNQLLIRKLDVSNWAGPTIRVVFDVEIVIK